MVYEIPTRIWLRNSDNVWRDASLTFCRKVRLNICLTVIDKLMNIVIHLFLVLDVTGQTPAEHRPKNIETTYPMMKVMPSLHNGQHVYH